MLRTLLSNIPVTTTTYSRRVALESILSEIEGHIYEEVFPDSLLAQRVSSAGREYLVRWCDGAFHSTCRTICIDFKVGYDDTWVSEMDISDDLVAIFSQNMEQVQGKPVLTAAVGQCSMAVQKLIKVRALT